MSDYRVSVFFYGSYMNPAVLRESGIELRQVEVARLDDFALTIGPLANVRRSPGSAVWGIVAELTHDQLTNLYRHAREVLGGTYLPEAVIVRDEAGAARAALCYVAPELEPGPAASDYVDRLLGPAREHGFPAAYLETIESFRPRGEPK